MFDLRMTKRWMYAALWIAGIAAVVAEIIFGRGWIAHYF